MSLTTLSNSDIVALTAWRRALHMRPELSGQEAETAKRAGEMLAPTGADEIITSIGGHGLAAIYDSGVAGPSVILRTELDALPIQEKSDAAHRSQVDGVAHLCGHEGHMSIIAGVARTLARHRPKTGRAILLFQPAEEDGAGAARMIADPKFATLKADYAFALHNMPGMPFGHAAIEAGAMNCASRGLRIELSGKTAHASWPETGVSPAPAVAELISALAALSRADSVKDPAFRLVTITHAQIGEAAFGVAPGDGELWATLRCVNDAEMAALVAAAEAEVTRAAQAHGLEVTLSYHDIFQHCENNAEATKLVQAALDAEKIPHTTGDLPMRASEDFGRFGEEAKSAMFLLGAGEGCAALHNPDYDFPDELIPIGARIFLRLLDDLLGLEA